jgi:hypothetical protein
MATKANKDHDSHGTEFERVPGPGPKDAGKGAAGSEAMDRIERRPEGAHGSPGSGASDEGDGPAADYQPESGQPGPRSTDKE